MLKESKVKDCLRKVIDPEIGINIVDLGLIYEINIEDKLEIVMTLTWKGCPLADVIVDNVKNVLKECGYKDFEVNLTFDPPWSPDLINEDVLEKLK